jgi:KEOPS complex subunit Pcc1
MRANATVRLEISSDRQMKTVLKSLEPEVRDPSSRRSHTSLTKDGVFLVLSIEAKDIVALRATLNSYLRWIDSVLNVFDVLEA